MKRFILFLLLGLFFSIHPICAKPININLEYPLNNNKTTSDTMIEYFYSQPDMIQEIDTECAKAMKWIGSTIEYGMEKYYHRAILCLTWESNKKLNASQIDLLAKLKFAFNRVVTDLTNLKDYGAVEMMYTGYESNVMLAKKIYNTLYSLSLPICFKNSGFDYPDRQSVACSLQSSAHLLTCAKETNPQICMEQQVIQQFLSHLPQQKIDTQHIIELNSLTDSLISSLEYDKSKQKNLILDFYDFYIKMIEDIAYSLRYYIKHNI